MYRIIGWLLLSAVCTTGKIQAQEVDTMLSVQLQEVQVKDKHLWENDTARYRFNQMRHYIQIILPYVEAATGLFNELNEITHNPGISKGERRRLINAKEDEVRYRFEDRVKSLNETQGVLLMKLIARQTGVNIYAQLQEFKNPLTAIKWQAWARLHGFNINKKYRPEEEVLLEQVMMSLNYPLPAIYAKQ